MIYKKGDLFKNVSTGVIAHGANARGVMSSGFALGIKKKYPKCFEAYVADVEFYEIPLGENSVYTHSESLVIYNCITQENYGRDGVRYVSYDAIDTCMADMFHRIAGSCCNLNIPRMCAGLGGGNWSIIESIIDINAKEFGFDTDKIICWEL
jgi:O-acetyl-ADP-ribose deacetylase (regulator of RNase III)